MEITLGLLTDELDKYIYYYRGTETATVDSVLFSNTKKEHQIVILRKPTELANLDKKQIGVLQYFPEMEYKKKYLTKNFVIFKREVSCEEIANLVLSVLDKYAKWENEILRSISQNDNLVTFFKKCSRFLKNPIVLLNEELGLISYDTKGENVKDKFLWQDIIQENKIPMRKYIFLGKNSYLQKLANKHSLYTYPVEDGKFNMLSASVIVDEKVIVYLGSTSIVTDFSAGQLYLIRSIQKLLELYFRAQNNKTNLSLDTRFWQNILAGKGLSDETIESKISEYGWDKETAYYVMAFSLEEVYGQPSANVYYQKEIGERLAQAVVFFYENMIIAIQPFGKIDDASGDKLQRSLNGLNLLCGVSFLHHKFSEGHIAYQQAVYTLNYIRKHRELFLENDLLFFRQIFSPFLASFLSESGQDLGMIMLPEVKYLENYDLEHDDELVKTLLTYIKYHYSNKIAAEKLYVNRNTIGYRLDKIKRLTRLDVKDPELEYPLLITAILLEYAR
ncbi:helix-turn-helix domain-containing protein [Enterococcus faecium]|nr:helix-turn-helix domain-containing protein [Enterococcus faecium]